MVRSISKTCPVCGEACPDEMNVHSSHPLANFQQCPRCRLFVARERPSDGRLWCPLCDGGLRKYLYNYNKVPGATPLQVLYGGAILLAVCIAVLTYALMGKAAVLIATVPLLVGLMGVIYHLYRRGVEATR
jgi:hypothetical protein